MSATSPALSHLLLRPLVTIVARAPAARNGHSSGSHARVDWKLPSSSFPLSWTWSKSTNLPGMFPDPRTLHSLACNLAGARVHGEPRARLFKTSPSSPNPITSSTTPP